MHQTCSNKLLPGAVQNLHHIRQRHIQEQSREKSDPEDENDKGNECRHFCPSKVRDIFSAFIRFSQHGSLVHPKHVNGAEDDGEPGHRCKNR